MRISFVLFLFISLCSISSIGQSVDFDLSKAEVCYGEVSILKSLSTPPDGDSIIRWEWYWSGIISTLADGVGEEIEFPYSEAKTYPIYLKIITRDGYSEAFYQEVKIGNYPVADFTTENACADDFTYFIDLSTIDNGDLEDYLWEFENGDKKTEPNPDYWYKTSGTHNVRLTVTSNLGCSHDTLKQITIGEIPVFNFSFSGETTFTEGESLVVTAVGDFSEIVWSNDQTTNSIIITQGDDYEATVKNQEGCSKTKSFTTVVLDKVGITNLMTPNGDGYNDKFEIFHIDNHSPCQVSIFTRDGLLIYSSTDYDNTWDGKYNGNPLPEGVYYYVVNCNDGLSRKAALSIIR